MSLKTVTLRYRTEGTEQVAADAGKMADKLRAKVNQYAKDVARYEKIAADAGRKRLMAEAMGPQADPAKEAARQAQMAKYTEQAETAKRTALRKTHLWETGSILWRQELEAQGRKEGEKYQAKQDAKQAARNQIALENFKQAEREQAAADRRGIQYEANAAYAASRQKSFPQVAKGAKAGGKGGGGGHGDDTRGALNGFGGKMILGMAAGNLATSIAGDSSAGQMAGSAVSALLFGGPAMAAGVIALEALGAAMAAQREKVAEASRANRDYLSTLNQMASAWTGFSAGQIERSPFGSAMEKQKQTAQQAKLAASAAQAELAPDGRGIRTNLWEQITGEADVKEMKYDRLIDARARAGFTQGLATKEEEKQYQQFAQDQKDILSSKKQVYALDSMMPGFLKQQATLSAQISADAVQRHATQKEEVSAADAALEMADKTEQAVRKKYFSILPGQRTNADKDLFDQAQKAFADAQTNRKRLPGQQARQEDAATAEAAHQQEELQRQHDAEIEQQQYRTSEAVVRADKYGYEQQRALREEAYRYELMLAARQGAAMLALKEEEVKKLREADAKQARREVEGELAAYDPKAANAVNDRKMAELQAKGATKEEAEKIETGAYYKEAAAAKIDAALANKQITMEEAEIQRAMLNDQRAYGNARVAAAIKVAAAAKEESAYAAQARRYLEAGKQTNLDIAVTKREMSVRDAEVQREILADHRAQENTQHGAQLREQIAQNADKKQQLRDAEAGMRVKRQDLDTAYKMRTVNYKDYQMAALKLDNPGVSDKVLGSMYESQRRADVAGHWQQMQGQQFGTGYSPGMVDFKALNAGYQSKNQMDLTKDGNEWLRQIFNVLSARQGGFN